MYIYVLYVFGGYSIIDNIQLESTEKTVSYKHRTLYGIHTLLLHSHIGIYICGVSTKYNENIKNSNLCQCSR